MYNTVKKNPPMYNMHLSPFICFFQPLESVLESAIALPRPFGEKRTEPSTDSAAQATIFVIQTCRNTKRIAHLRHEAQTGTSRW